MQNFSRVVATKCSNHYTIFPLQMTVVILKLNDERRKKKEILVMYFYCDLVADKKWRIIRKKNINIFLPHTSSAEQQLVWPPNHWRESNICSKLKFLDQNLNRHHSPPALKPPPRFSPRQEKKIKSKYKKKICLRLWSISVNFCFCLSYSLIVFQNNPQPPFFL